MDQESDELRLIDLENMEEDSTDDEDIDSTDEEDTTEDDSTDDDESVVLLRRRTDAIVHTASMLYILARINSIYESFGLNTPNSAPHALRSPHEERERSADHPDQLTNDSVSQQAQAIAEVRDDEEIPHPQIGDIPHINRNEGEVDRRGLGEYPSDSAGMEREELMGALNHNNEADNVLEQNNDEETVMETKEIPVLQRDPQNMPEPEEAAQEEQDSIGESGENAPKRPRLTRASSDNTSFDQGARVVWRGRFPDLSPTGTSFIQQGEREDFNHVSSWGSFPVFSNDQGNTTDLSHSTEHPQPLYPLTEEANEGQPQHIEEEDSLERRLITPVESGTIARQSPFLSFFPEEVSDETGQGLNHSQLPLFATQTAYLSVTESGSEQSEQGDFTWYAQRGETPPLSQVWEEDELDSEF
jgi:hypothetical protein